MEDVKAYATFSFISHQKVISVIIDLHKLPRVLILCLVRRLWVVYFFFPGKINSDSLKTILLSSDIQFSVRQLATKQITETLIWNTVNDTEAIYSSNRLMDSLLRGWKCYSRSYAFTLETFPIFLASKNLLIPQLVEKLSNIGRPFKTCLRYEKL